MSEFRIFCIALFVGMGLAAALHNHTGFDAEPIGIILMGLSIASGSVALFGKRKAGAA